MYMFYLFSQTFLTDDRYTYGQDFISSLTNFALGRSLSVDEKKVLLLTLLKFFFVPYLCNGFVQHVKQLNYLTVDLYRYYWLMDEFDKPRLISNWQSFIFSYVFAAVCLIDLVPYLIGYLTQRPGAEIKSVDTSVKGWIVCLACYPPFNSSVGSFIPVYTPEYIGFEAGQWGIYYNVISLTFLTCFALCSVNLGFKATNLTSRGIVTTGFYSIVRHPAYAFKLAAWTTCAIGGYYVRSIQDQPRVWELVTLLGWAYLYYVRAKTEERHLIETDPDYAKYCVRVRYRFIPGVF